MSAVISDSRVRASTAASILILLMLTSALAVGCGGDGALTIDEAKLAPGDLEGWTIVKEIEVTTGNAAEGSIVKELFEAGAVRIRDQYLAKDGKTLQVNFVEMKDAQGAEEAAAMLKKAVGSVNTIGVKENMAVEVIGQPEGKELVVKKLELTD